MVFDLLEGYDRNGGLQAVLFGREFPTNAEKKQAIRQDLLNMCNYIARR